MYKELKRSALKRSHTRHVPAVNRTPLAGLVARLCAYGSSSIAEPVLFRAMVSGYHNLADVTAVLVTTQKWSNMIRNGLKTMELRSCSMRKYEGQWVGFAVSGCHAIWGAGRISKSILLDEQSMFTPNLLLQHCVTPEDLSHLRAALTAKGAKEKPWKKIYGLSLHGVVTFPQPVRYHHPCGAIGLVRLVGNEVFERARAVALARPMPRDVLSRRRAGTLRPLVQRRRK